VRVFDEITFGAFPYFEDERGNAAAVDKVV
jgi:hypothetical protein